MLIADVTPATTIVGTRFSVLGLGSPMLGDGYVKWLLVRVGSDVVRFGVEGLQGLCQMGEPSYLLEADDCDGDIAVVGMMMGIDGKKRRHWFLLIIIL